MLDTYIRLHEKITVGEHWLWVALERIASGEPEKDVLADYGYMWARPIVHNGEVRGASRLAGEASSAEGATSTVVLGAERPGKE